MHLSIVMMTDGLLCRYTVSGLEDVEEAELACVVRASPANMTSDDLQVTFVNQIEEDCELSLGDNEQLVSQVLRINRHMTPTDELLDVRLID